MTGDEGDANPDAAAASAETGDETASDDLGAVIEELFETIEDRKRELPEDSYTASLFTHEKGQNAVLEKLGEETTEIILAAKDDDREELAHESADFVYHLLVLLSMQEMGPDELRDELEARF